MKNPYVSRLRTRHGLCEIDNRLRWWLWLSTSESFLVNHNYLSLSGASFCLPSGTGLFRLHKVNIFHFYCRFFLKITGLLKIKPFQENSKRNIAKRFPLTMQTIWQTSCHRKKIQISTRNTSRLCLFTNRSNSWKCIATNITKCEWKTSWSCHKHPITKRFCVYHT